MKRLLITILVFASLSSFAQTFKITDVETSEERRYQEANKKFMNKEFKITFNDNSISVSPTTKNNPLTLRKQNTSTYSYSTKMGDVTKFYTVVFKKTFGVISSMIMTFGERSGTSVAKTEYVKITGKRF